MIKNKIVKEKLIKNVLVEKEKMNIYYLCGFSLSEKNNFEKTLLIMSSYEDVDKYIDENFVIFWRDNLGKHKSWFIFEAYLFVKYMWKEHWVKPSEIKWLYNSNMVILNDDLYVFYNWKYESTYWKNTYFFTSRGAFDDVFWTFWDKISSRDDKYARLISTNKDLEYKRIEKITHIMNMYEKREELLWDFMLPLMKSKSLYDIWKLLELWVKVTWKVEVVMKWSHWVDNWELIKLIDINDYLWVDDRLEYLYLKFFNYLKTYSNMYFVNYYDIEKEQRLYFSRNFHTKEYDLYSVKEKINLTWKYELYDKISFSTWGNIKIRWELWDNDIWEELLKNARYVLSKNNMDAWTAEFIKDIDWNWRFLEINCLGWGLMFDWQDKENIKNRTLGIWDNIFNRYK